MKNTASIFKILDEEIAPQSSKKAAHLPLSEADRVSLELQELMKMFSYESPAQRFGFHCFDWYF